MNTTALIITIAVVLGLLVLYYLVKLALIQTIRVLAGRNKLFTFLKEGRIIQVDDGEGFKSFVMHMPGKCFAWQHPDNKKKVWGKESERWEVVECPNFNFIEETKGLRRWAYVNTGAYLFDTGYFTRKIRIREIKVYTYDVNSTVIKQIPQHSPYIFANNFPYAFEIRNAEDVNGLSYKIQFVVIAAGNNPYTAVIENAHWDQSFATIATSAPLPTIKKYPFHNLSNEVKNITGVTPTNQDEIAEEFAQEVLDALNNLEIGFKFVSVNLRDIQPEDPETFKPIIDFYKSTYEKRATIERGQGVNAVTEEKLKIEREDIKERLGYLAAQNPELQKWWAFMNTKIQTLGSLEGSGNGIILPGPGTTQTQQTPQQ